MNASETQSAPLMMVVDDDLTFRQTLARAMRRRGYRVIVAHDYDSALSEAAQWSPSLAVVDLKMPGRDGVELVRALQRAHDEIRIVVLTAFGSIDTAVLAMRAGAAHYLTKPAETNEIVAAFKEHQSTGDLGYTKSLAEVEWEHIEVVMAESGGNVSEAARRLGMHRRSLQRKLARGRPLDE